MNTQDLLNVSIAVGFLVVVGFLCWVLYQLAKALRAVRGVAEDIKSTTSDIDALKNAVKIGLTRLSYTASQRARRRWSK